MIVVRENRGRGRRTELANFASSQNLQGALLGASRENDTFLLLLGGGGGVGERGVLFILANV